jgi:ectoine hydroxylase-related dioxygenase (phytanoyl-CoA dioxygenase family)
MVTDVTPEQVRTYQAQGFIVIENFLDAGELEHWRTVTADAINARLGNSQNLSNQANPDAFYAQVFTQCLRLADIHAGMAELIFDERLGRVAGTLAGVDGIRIWHDQALVKPPYGNHTAFHLDNPFWSFDSPNAISIWVALDDATLANGCLWYLPGTHREATYEPTGIGENLGSLFKAYPQWKQIEAIPAVCKAGGAVFHNGLIAHGAGANMTPRGRRAMTCAFMPDGSTFNGKQNVLPDDYYQSLKVGDRLDNDAINRLTWRREAVAEA